MGAYFGQSQEFVGRKDSDGTAGEVGCIPCHQVSGARLDGRVQLYRIFQVVDAAIIHRQVQYPRIDRHYFEYVTHQA